MRCARLACDAATAGAIANLPRFSTRHNETTVTFAAFPAAAADIAPTDKE